MRGGRCIAAVVLTLVALTTHARSEAPTRRVGAMIDAGIPDGLTASLVYRPDPQLRLHAGASHNFIAPGLRIGGTLRLLRSRLSPSASLEFGHYAEGDANPLAQMVSGYSMAQLPILDRVGYQYSNAHLGIELCTTRMTLYLHAGVSRLWTRAHKVSETLEQEEAHKEGEPYPEVRSAAHITATGPSARLGLIVYY